MPLEQEKKEQLEEQLIFDLECLKEKTKLMIMRYDVVGVFTF